MTIVLTGAGLNEDMLAAIADGAPVDLAPEGLARMRQTHQLIARAIAADQPIYGITTGLGPRVVERLSAEERAQMALNTVRGRAHSVGAPMDRRLVRAAMAVRANTLLIGASGADPALARAIADCLNAGLCPLVRETGSIGAADLMWGGAMGLGLIGEGEMETATGRRPAAEALADAGLAPYLPGPRDGLAMVSNSSFVAAIAAIGVSRAESVFESAQTAAAVTLEGFRANLSPLRFRVLALRPQPGQMEAAAGIVARLDGSALHRPGTARRVQDPLSLRNVAQIHGAVVAALDAADVAVREEINAASDNPVVVASKGEVLSAGGYLTPHLSIVLGALAQAFVHLAAAQVARMSKLINRRFTDLPVGLAARDTASAGMAPASKSAEALFSEIVHLAQPAPVYPSGAADGVEDVVAHSAVPAMALLKIVDRLEILTAMELMFAAQAVELRALDEIAPSVARAVGLVRQRVAAVTDDRSLSGDIMALAEDVAAGVFQEP